MQSMKIEFIAPAAEDIISVYETYRTDEEPDSPEKPFWELDDEEKKRLIKSYFSVVRIVAVDLKKVGWITIVERDYINLGFGLFRDHRGKGLMSHIIREAGRLLREINPDTVISSSARKDNHAAIKSLQKGEFIKAGEEKRPPLGKYTSPVDYVVFKFSMRGNKN